MAAIDDSVLNTRDLATLDKTTHRLPTLTETALVSGQGLLTTAAGNAAYATAAAVALKADTSTVSSLSATVATHTTAIALKADSSTVSAKADSSSIAPTAKTAATAIGVVPTIRYAAGWAARSTWIAANIPGYVGPINWNSVTTTGVTAPTTAARDAGSLWADTWERVKPA